MLSLEIPAVEIDGVLVYADHAVATAFYYAAPHPRITRTGGRLLFDVFAYRVDLAHSPLAGTTIPDELGAGFLTMGVNCALSDSKHADIVRSLAERVGVPEAEISLAPIPYDRGTVSVLALDQFATPGEPAAAPQPASGRPTFVERVIGSGTPMLLGDLRTILSLALSQDGVTFLRGLYEDGAAPVGIVYELEFFGLRPAVEATVTADLSRIHEHFGGGLDVNVSWFRADIDAALDVLTEQSAIRVELTSQATGEEAQRSKELALSLFKERIVQEMFRPTAPAVPSLGDAASVLADAAVSTAAGGRVALTLRATRREELKTVTYDFRERSPEKRTHSPQGFLPVLLSEAELAQRVHEVDLDSDFFELLEVLVAGPDPQEFDALSIRQVEATLTYGQPGDAEPPESRTLLFRPDATGDKVFALKRRGRESLAYDMALTYEFVRRAGSDTDTLRYELPARSLTSRAPRINPYDDFAVLDVEVEPGVLDPTIAQIDVMLAAGDGTAFRAEEHIRLFPGEDVPPRRWQVRALEADLRRYTAARTFRFSDGAVYEAPPITSTEPLLRVDSPFPHHRELLIRPNVTSDAVMRITVELLYSDIANGYERRFLETLDRSEDGRFETLAVRWPIVDATSQLVRYRVTTHESGFIGESDWEETADPSIIVGSVGTRIAGIDVRLIGPPLDEVGLDAVQLKVAAMNGSAPGEPQSLLLVGTEASHRVNLPLPPGASLRYRYQTTAFRIDGRIVESAWKQNTDPLLVLSTRTL